MTMTNAEWMIKSGYKFKDIYIGHSRLENRIYEIYIGTALIDTYRVHDEITWCEVLMNWLDMKHKYPILDNAERKYLAAVIKPFRNEKLEIVKHSACDGSEEWLNFVREKGSFYLPNFKTGTMYKGMEPGHKYTLEELGL